MKVLVVGATGFLGRSAAKALAAGGHSVRGLIRGSELSRAMQALGIEPVIGDLLAPGTLRSAMRGCEQIVHLAQPGGGDLAARRRVRVDGCRALIEAAVDEGVPRLLVGSGYWVYRSAPGTITEESELDPRSISLVNFETEQVAREARTAYGIEVVVARPGMVYGNGSWFAEMVGELKTGRHRYVGDGSNYLSPVHLDDAGEAFRCLAERGADGGTYLVVDDLPVTTLAFTEYVAEQIHASSARGISMAEASGEWGADLATLNAASRSASNAKLRSLGWVPKFPTFRDGLPTVLASMA